MSVDEYESAVEFLAARADWLKFEIIERGNGAWDVALVIDGTYASELLGTREGSIDDFAVRLAGALRREGIPVKRGLAAQEDAARWRALVDGD
jgi:hypothetical protein